MVLRSPDDETWKKVTPLLLAEDYVRKELENNAVPDVTCLALRLQEQCPGLTSADADDIVRKSILAAEGSLTMEKLRS